MQCDDCRELLNAYVDGEMMPEEARGIRDHLAACGACARAHESIVATSHLLQEGLVHYSAPDVLKARIHSALTQPVPQAREARTPRGANRRAWLAAAGILIALGSSAVTYSVVEQGMAARAATAEVLASHVRSLMPGHLTDVVSNNQHNVKPWFNGRVNLSPAVPALDSAGFTLVGGRLDYLAGHPVAVVVYSRRQHVINVYSWPDPGSDTPARVTTEQGYHLVHWRSQNIASWAASDLNASELAQLVSLLRE